ncbi:MAG: methyltransferase domain-containing protein [Chitinispirillaceae bacterium]|nr:methyltransferase domain-containing protein [Chitinispirillaceae bacterium]
MKCRLCYAPACRLFISDAGRDYYHCGRCDLIFVPESSHVSFDEERARYDLHDNKPDHEGYRTFLDTVADCLVRVCDPPGKVLDFGSGPNAILTSLLRERGVDCTAYDPLYGIGKEALLGSYDTIALCEVIEHLRCLNSELGALRHLLRPGGRMLIRTKIHPGPDAFASWWYRSDITHINFLGPATPRHIGTLFGFRSIDSGENDMIVMEAMEDDVSMLKSR